LWFDTETLYEIPINGVLALKSWHKFLEPFLQPLGQAEGKIKTQLIISDD